LSQLVKKKGSSEGFTPSLKEERRPSIRRGKRERKSKGEVQGKRKEKGGTGLVLEKYKKRREGTKGNSGEVGQSIVGGEAAEQGK